MADNNKLPCGGRVDQEDKQLHLNTCKKKKVCLSLNQHLHFLWKYNQLFCFTHHKLYKNENFSRICTKMLFFFSDFNKKHTHFLITS